ncbi:XRE family transcriptional regulator [Filobacillus milosensis]|uniref:XRE family transcriptional regulator n=1 Tax=Filobacillus milosensis TaxID=94137 RepID=A0A4Y8II79_9BACI|nr:helix-turn-helix transcriptional regulator [Filobacillus milosensis]TFB18928.1 XRE family transcriptional regulator [Filobacillus milosensis]
MSLVGKMIKWHRNDQGMTQEQLAEGICSVTQLSKIENNQIPANDDLLLAIANRLNIPKEKVLNTVDPSYMSLINKWLNEIHEYNLPGAQETFEQLKKCSLEDEPYDVEFLYYLALFGYLLITNQPKKADKIHRHIKTYEDIFEDVAPYSFHKFYGEFLKNKGLYIDALRHLKEAECILQDIEDPELLMLLAIVNSHLENVLSSNRYARLALKKFQEKLFYSRIIECEIILSANYTFIHEFSMAKEQLNRLVKLIDEKLDPRSVVKIYFHIALIHCLKRELDEAERLLKYSLSVDTDETELIHSRYLISHMYYLKGDLKQAKQYIEAGQKFAEEYALDYYLMKFKVLNYLVEDEKEVLIDYLNKRAIPFLRVTGQAFDMKYYQQLLGILYYKLKKYKKAAEILIVADSRREQLMDFK